MKIGEIMKVIKNSLDFKDENKIFILNHIENYDEVIIVAEIKFLLEEEEKGLILESFYPYSDVLCYFGMKNKEYYYLFFFKTSSETDSGFIFNEISFEKFSTEKIYLNPYFKKKYDKNKELDKYKKYLIQKNIVKF
tara:strand:- start:4585 stop:4992 length:408 start_codon:yes stop_codon:yes gene_type:complete